MLTRGRWKEGERVLDQKSEIGKSFVLTKGRWKKSKKEENQMKN